LNIEITEATAWVGLISSHMTQTVFTADLKFVWDNKLENSQLLVIVAI